jgi:hypothetical protein
MTAKPEGNVRIEEAGPQKFTLVVTYKGERFDCGNYISRGAAMQAGRLFLERKAGEEAGHLKRPRKKK